MNKTPIKNLTRKSMERTTQHILRVNATSETHALPIRTPDKMRQRAGSAEVYAPRIKRANEAMPPSNHLWSRDTYRTGDGEVRGAMRPGSEDAMKLPSRGYST
jgi:hypothetical protein